MIIFDDHDVLEDEVQDGGVEDDDVKGEKHDHVDVEEEEDGDVEEGDLSQNWEAQNVRGCAIEMHINSPAQNANKHLVRDCTIEHVHMSQETSEEPLNEESVQKNVN